MSTPTTVPAATPSLTFRDGIDPRTQADAIALTAALSRGAKPFVRAFSLHGARAIERQGERLYEFIGVSEGIKRDGSIVRVGGIDWAGYDLNPVFLLAHDYTGLPIGRVVERRTEQVPGLGGAVKILVQSASGLDLGTEQRDLVRSTFALYDGGFLNTVSFGWNVLEATPLQDTEGRFSGFDFIRTDALEFSAVPVPADPQAGLQRAMEQGLLKPELLPYFVANHKRPMRSAVYSLREMPIPVTTSNAPLLADCSMTTQPIDASMTTPALYDAAGYEVVVPEQAAGTEKRPYIIEADSPVCPIDKPFAVVKLDDGQLMGCFASEDKAKAQMAALYAKEPAASSTASARTSDDVPSGTSVPPEPGSATDTPAGTVVIPPAAEEPATEQPPPVADDPPAQEPPPAASAASALVLTTSAIRDAVNAALASVPVMRKGAVLSARNKQKITQAMAMMDDAMAQLKAVMADAMKEMQGEEMPAEEMATAIPTATREPEPIIPIAAGVPIQVLDDMRARLEELERNAPQRRRLYDDLFREASRGQVAASRLREKTTRLGKK